jgi:hypothetical protein
MLEGVLKLPLRVTQGFDIKTELQFTLHLGSPKRTIRLMGGN